MERGLGTTRNENRSLFTTSTVGFWTNSKSNWYISIRFLHYGTEGILDDEDDDNGGRPLMFPFSFDISDECRNDHSANVTQQWVSNNYGIAIYQKVLTIIYSHHPSET
jgi:hypothetical protein